MNGNRLREAVRLSLTLNGSKRRVARIAGVAPNTIRKFRRIAGKHEITWEKIKDFDDTKLEQLFHASKRRLSGKRPPDWVYMHQQMQGKYQTLLELWEAYRRDDPNQAYSYSQFTHLYRQYVAKLDLTMRQVHYAGETAFVDFAGGTVPWTDTETGKVFHAHLFVAVLGCSNYTFVWACRSQKLPEWIQAHVRLLAFLGGVPQTIVPDQLRSAVTQTGRDPEINRTYQECARHYGTVIVPTRPRKPRDKGKVEAGVLFISRWITTALRRRTFFSVDEINEAIADLLQQLNERPFKRLPGCRRSRFEELDKLALKPLPSRAFEFAEWTALQKVGPDYHVYAKNHAYSVPFQLVAEQVEARVACRVVEIFHRGKRVAIHYRNDDPGTHTTDPTHRPPQHRAYADQTPERFVQWAEKVGPATVLAIQAQFKNRPDHSVIGKKACSQLQQLCRLYDDPERFEAACRRAATIKSLTVKSVRSILQHRLHDVNADEISIQATLPLHNNVRGASYYHLGGN